MTVICLSGCGDLKSVKYADTVILQEFSPDYGLVYGMKGLYVVYGSYKTDRGNLQAGECVLIDPPGTFKFSLKEFLAAEPSLTSNTDIQKASENQCLHQ